MRRMRPQHCWQAMMFVATLAAFTALPSTVGAQSRGSSGLPGAPGNPFAALQNQVTTLQNQVSTLTQAIANLGGGGSTVQAAAEQNLVVVRGTVAGASGQVLAGKGFTVITNPTTDPNFVTYTVLFDAPFSSDPSVVVSVHGFFPTQFVQTIAVDDGAGGISTGGFTAYIAAPSNTIGSFGSFGSQNWDFIAIGPR